MSKQYSIRLSDEAAEILDRQENKSQFVSDRLLNNQPAVSAVPWLELEFKLDTILSKLNTQPPVATIAEKPKEFVPKPPDPVTGYPCCTKAKPCKHWNFDGADNTWTNQLTGEVKEVVS